MYVFHYADKTESPVFSSISTFVCGTFFVKRPITGKKDDEKVQF